MVHKKRVNALLLVGAVVVGPQINVVSVLESVKRFYLKVVMLNCFGKTIKQD